MKNEDRCSICKHAEDIGYDYSVYECTLGKSLCEYVCKFDEPTEKTNSIIKTRIARGKAYWFVDFSKEWCVDWLLDARDEVNNIHFRTCNYFYTKEEAESVLRKLNATFKGTGDVVEIFPDEEEIFKMLPDDVSDDFSAGIYVGWKKCCDWIRSKIIK